MFNLKAVTEVDNMTKRILSDMETETADLQDLIAAEGEAIAAANAEMETATAAGDLKAYQKAKRDRQDALDAKEMHQKRLEALEQRPLISKPEYEKAVADIFAEIAAADDQTKAALVKLSDEMNAAALALDDAIIKANAVLQRLQHDIYRDADRTHNPKTGEVAIALTHEEKRYKKHDTVSWGRAGVKAPQYEAYTGRKAAL